MRSEWSTAEHAEEDMLFRFRQEFLNIVITPKHAERVEHCGASRSTAEHAENNENGSERSTGEHAE